MAHVEKITKAMCINLKNNKWKWPFVYTTFQLRRFSRHNVMQFEYQIKFSRSGIHNVLFFSKAEPEDIDADYSAVFFSNLGDKFYLLMSKSNKEELIIKAFNAKYYTLAEDDFDYIDGK